MADLVIDSTNYRKAILAPLLAILWLIPGIILIWGNHSNPTALLDLSAVQYGLNTNQGITAGSGAGYESLLAVIAQLTSADMRLLLYLPIGSLLVPLIYYLAARKLSSPKYAALTSIFIAFLTPLVTAQYSLLLFVWASVILLAFMLALSKYLQSRSSGIALAIISLFVASLFVHRALAVLLVIALVVASVGGRSWRKRSVKVSPVLEMAAFSLILYFIFEFHFYESLLPAAASDGLANPGADLQYILGNSFWTKADYVADPLRHPDPTGAITGICTVLSFFLLALPIAFGLTVARKRMRSMKHEVNSAVIVLLLIATFSVFIGDLLVNYLYYDRGFDLYAVFVLFPLILPTAFSIIGRTTFRTIGRQTMTYAFALLIAAMIGFAAFQVDAARTNPASSTDDVAAFWLDHGNQDEIMTAGLDAYTMFSLSLAERGSLPPALAPINSSGYRYLVGMFNGTAHPADYFLFVADDFNSPLIGYDWSYYQPMDSAGSLALDDNANLTLAFDDGSSMLFSRQ